MTTWREHEFINGQLYRVVATFSSATDTFQEGTVVTFVDTAYSRYDSCSGFHFRSATGEIMSFDVSDDEDLTDWVSRFAPLNNE